ncbi:putative transcription factor kapC [Glarea lozoyensis 74030]|uniref:Putative transcription factor kapC n=1 Tax=Glarea lozoyensis (strain ATCC 74030 / MF5533) TaxID=1104152 RepID=H0EVP5_GLAL7|nr:putative transcription factor kapC [Glarea lozoyensis 74030]
MAMQSIAPAPMPQMQSQHGGPPHGYNEVPASSSASPHEHNIDPSIGGPGGMMSAGGGDSGGDDNLGDGRKGGKRELSQSKRAAQNRAAQRAFRQRKEGYIKKLEEQVRGMHALEDNYKSIQSENYSLREYIIHLQSRLIESQGEFPQPPPNVNLNHPSDVTRSHDGAPVAAMSGMNTLNANAARNLAAASLNSNAKHAHEEPHNYDHKRFKDAATEEAADEDIIRSQLQASADGLPAPAMQS